MQVEPGRVKSERRKGAILLTGPATVVESPEQQSEFEGKRLQAARNIHVSTMESGFSDKLLIPCSINHFARSG